MLRPSFSLLASQFVAAVPAMYQLGLLGGSPKEDFARLFTFTLVSAYYGCFFAIVSVLSLEDGKGRIGRGATHLC